MRPFLIPLFALTLIGCNQRVQVVDPAGKPVQGAQVAPVTPSITGTPATTDAKGETSVSLSIRTQKTQWVSVSKTGFASQQVPIPASWPLKVVLQPVP